MSSDEDDELFGPSGSGQTASSGTDEELTLPRAAMNKMIKEVMPNVRVANEARELILQCSTDFIHLLSSEANEICDKQQKKTISPEHVLQGKYYSEGKSTYPLLTCNLNNIPRFCSFTSFSFFHSSFRQSWVRRFSKRSRKCNARM